MKYEKDKYYISEIVWEIPPRTHDYTVNVFVWWLFRIIGFWYFKKSSEFNVLYADAF